MIFCAGKEGGFSLTLIDCKDNIPWCTISLMIVFIFFYFAAFYSMLWREWTNYAVSCFRNFEIIFSKTQPLQMSFPWKEILILDLLEPLERQGCLPEGWYQHLIVPWWWLKELWPKVFFNFISSTSWIFFSFFASRESCSNQTLL